MSILLPFQFVKLVKFLSDHSKLPEMALPCPDRVKTRNRILQWELKCDSGIHKCNSGKSVWFSMPEVKL
ncbi:MAG: hypothetical protein ACI8P9_005088 [Parasphingorhabdus sp.]|jgi:hypothetical protein